MIFRVPGSPVNQFFRLRLDSGGTGCVTALALSTAIMVWLLITLWAVLDGFLNAAAAHDALPTASKPQGWSYPFSCCSGYDCREIDASRVHETRSGYQLPTGEVIPYSGDTRLRDSPDGAYHWCSVAGADDSRTICLFAPPRSY